MKRAAEVDACGEDSCEGRQPTKKVNARSGISEDAEPYLALPADDLSHYARQMTLVGFGPDAQKKLQASKILVVGAGGLGSPVILYLAGAGVGKLGIADGDTVDRSNLHRQIIHRECRQGMSKALSAAEAVRALNSQVVVQAYSERITPQNARDIVPEYDIVVDATDSVGARYLLSDICCVLQKPLVTGAALRGSGQVQVLCVGQGCYRCLHPTPPSPSLVMKADTAGVLGPAVGIFACMEACEAIKLATGLYKPLVGCMFIGDVFSNMYRCPKIRGAQTTCPCCGENPTICTMDDVAKFDYDAFCRGGTSVSPSAAPEPQLISAGDLLKLWNAHKVFIVDVRSKSEYEFLALSHNPARCVNLPMILGRIDTEEDKWKAALKGVQKAQENGDTVVVICRKGTDSVNAAKEFAAKGLPVKVLKGGLLEWAKVEPAFPSY